MCYVRQLLIREAGQWRKRAVPESNYIRLGFVTYVALFAIHRVIYIQSQPSLKIKLFKSVGASCCAGCPALSATPKRPTLFKSFHNPTLSVLAGLNKCFQSTTYSSSFRAAHIHP